MDTGNRSAVTVEIESIAGKNIGCKAVLTITIKAASTPYRAVFYDISSLIAFANDDLVTVKSYTIVVGIAAEPDLAVDELIFVVKVSASFSTL